MAFTTPLKQRIHSGEVLIGAFVPPNSSKARLEQVLSFYPYDFFHVDSQHVPYDEERIVEFCSFANEFEVPVVLRIKHSRHAYLVGAYADLGLTGVEVPQVETEEIANEALEFFYYPPAGKRSSGGVHVLGFTPTAGRDTRVDYAEWWNRSGVLMLQVESIEAITMAKRLAKPGVDCLSWGAAPHSADLAFSLENNREHPFKTDDDCLEYTIGQLRGTDTKMFVRIDGAADREKYLKMGATVLRENPPAI
jgi:2-keto-3-deoxy-L-rhamnonate aldolase RhmA